MHLLFSCVCVDIYIFCGHTVCEAEVLTQDAKMSTILQNLWEQIEREKGLIKDEHFCDENV